MVASQEKRSKQNLCLLPVTERTEGPVEYILCNVEQGQLFFKLIRVKVSADVFHHACRVEGPVFYVKRKIIEKMNNLRRTINIIPFLKSKMKSLRYIIDNLQRSKDIDPFVKYMTYPDVYTFCCFESELTRKIIYYVVPKEWIYLAEKSEKDRLIVALFFSFIKHDKDAGIKFGRSVLHDEKLHYIIKKKIKRKFFF